MRWRCTLLQRWLPEYPDGDLPAFWKARLARHLEHCPTCRQELAALREVVEVIKTAPVPDPGPEFWAQFSRELHVKLAQVAHQAETVPAAPASKRFKLPYLLGASALALLLLWAVTHFSNPERPTLVPPPRMAQKAAPATGTAPQMAQAPKSKASPATRAVTPAPEPSDQVTYVTLDEAAGLAADDLEMDISGWDLDAELAGMTDREKEMFLKKLHQREGDGSCLKKYSCVFWA
jgi:anti-sigma factor RsiW